MRTPYTRDAAVKNERGVVLKNGGYNVHCDWCGKIGHTWAESLEEAKTKTPEEWVEVSMDGQLQARACTLQCAEAWCKNAPKSRDVARTCNGFRLDEIPRGPEF